jgi:hypothetical protein
MSQGNFNQDGLNKAEGRSMNNHTPPQLAAKITVFRSHRGILSKHISLGPDGAPKSDGSACAMSSGTAVRTHRRRDSSSGTTVMTAHVPS